MDGKEKLQNLKQLAKKHSLYDSSKKIVIGKGQLNNPDVLFTSEAPGKEENKIGIPFIGRSGKMLDSWIKHFDIKNWAVINVVPLIPLDNKDKIRKPTTEEVDYFKPVVLDLIKSINPKKIICLGKVAQECIGEGKNIKFVYHPAYYLRKGLTGISDMKKALEEKELEEKKDFIKEIANSTKPTEEVVSEFLEKIGAEKISKEEFVYKNKKVFIDYHPFDHSDDIIISEDIVDKYDNFLLVKTGASQTRIPGWCSKEQLKSTLKRDIYRNGKYFYMVIDVNLKDLSIFRLEKERKLKTKFVINKQKADALSREEYINSVLAGLHYFAKQANIFFKDINQKDECFLGEKRIKVYTRDITSDEDMLVRDSYFKKHPEIDIYMTCKVKAGEYWYVGYVTKERVQDTRVIKMIGSENENESSEIRRMFAEQYSPISDLIKIFEKEEKEEEVIKQSYVPLHIHSDFCLTGEANIKTLTGGGIKLSKLYKLYSAGKKLPKIYDGKGKTVIPKRIFDTRKQEVFEIITKNNKRIIASKGHKFYTKSGWKRLDELVKGDKVIVQNLGKEISERQKKKFITGQLKNFLKFSEKTRFKKGVPSLYRHSKGYIPWNAKKSLNRKSESIEKKYKKSLKIMRRKKKEWWKRISKEQREGILKKLKPYKKGHVPHNKGKVGWGRWLHEKYPGSHPNEVLAKAGNISIWQKKLYEIIKKKYPKAILNYRIKTNRTFRYLDVAILSLKFDFEYDGVYWHSSEEATKSDRERDKEIKEIGWKTIRVNKNNFKKIEERFKNGIY